MIIDHQRRYIFIAVPKTASISIQTSLGHGIGIPEPPLYHQGIAAVLADHPDCADYFKFAFVRNPWARLASLYYDFTKKRGYWYSERIRHDQPLLHEFKDFEDLCLRLPESSWAQDLFFKTQIDQLSVAGRLAMDFVGRYENLVNDYQTICQRLGIASELLTMNVGVYEKTGDAPYRHHYSEIARDAVATHYRADIEAFDYEF